MVEFALRLLQPPAGLSNVVALSSTASASLALMDNGTVVGWGQDSGESQSVPVGLRNLVGISAGYSHSLALRNDGTVVGWGRDDCGQSSGSTKLSNVTAVSVGALHSLVLLADGTVLNWGCNNSGQIETPSDLDQVVAIAAGGGHNLALRADGRVTAWGYNGQSQANVPKGLSNVVAISAGAFHSLALRADGTVIAWGDNQHGQTNVPTTLNNVIGISAGLYRCVALQADGLVVKWGETDSEPLGGTILNDGGTNVLAVLANWFSIFQLAGSPSPKISGQPSDRVVEIGGTTYFRVSAIGRNPFSYQWRQNGTNLPGATNAVLTLSEVQPSQKGHYSVHVSNADSTTLSREAHLSVAPVWFVAKPKESDLFIGGSTEIAFDVRTSVPTTYQWLFNGGTIRNATNVNLVLDRLMLSATGSYSLLASNQYGVAYSPQIHLRVRSIVALGSNNYGQSKPPVPTEEVAELAAGLYQSLALLRDGNALSWGDGNPATFAITNESPLDLNNFVGIASGQNHSLALRADGTVVGWGDNGAGQTQVPRTVTNAIAVFAGGSQSIALNADHTLSAWGLISDFQANHIAGISNVIQVAAGQNHILALRKDGTVVSSGFYSGLAQRVQPPPGLSNVVAVAAGRSRDFALLSNGSVVSWKDSGFIVSGMDLFVPTSVETNSSDHFVALAAGDSHYAGLRNDGTMAVFGFNASGQTNTQVGLSNVVVVAAAGDYTIAALGGDRPSAVGPLVDRFGLLGRRVFFNAVARRKPPLSFQWKRNGVDLPGATNSVLLLTNLLLSQDGMYSFSVSNSEGVVTSGLSKLVVAPVRILKQPKERLVAVEGDAEFSVAVESAFPYHFQWRFNGSDLPEATNSMLHLKSVSFSAVGSYSVVVGTDVGAVTSKVAQLTVWEPLTVASRGRGAVEIEPGPYTYGDIVNLSAKPARWENFSHWSDGQWDNPRAVLIQATNRYLAIFTNVYAMERWTNGDTAQTWDVPAGTPRIYVNGDLTLGGTFTFPDINEVRVRLESTFDPNGVILYTTDGDEPLNSGFIYDAGSEIWIQSPTTLRVVALDADSSDLRPADLVRIDFIPTVRAWTRGGGQVQLEPAAAAYTPGATVTVNAKPAPGWTFVRWAGDALGTNPTVQLAIDVSKSIEGVFGTYITNSGINGGTILREPAEGPYPYGSSIRMSGVPQRGKYLDRWIRDAAGQMDNPLIFAVTNANPVVQAVFGNLPPNTFTLALPVEGEGTVARFPSQKWYYTNGTTVWLTNLPGPAQKFVDWQGDAVGTQNPLPVTMTKDKTIVARFRSTLAPSVALTSPTNDSSFGSPASIALAANATDLDGFVTRVDFLSDTNLIATRTAYPYSATWSNVTVGTYTLRAVAYDNSGLMATSAPVQLALNSPPHFRFAQASYSVVEGSGSVTIQIVNEGAQGGVVNFGLRSGSAEGGYNGAGDFELAQGALTFTNSQSSNTITIAINNDSLLEPREVLEVVLSSPDDTLGKPAVASVIIIDDDALSASESSLGFRWPELSPAANARIRVSTVPAEAEGQWRFRWESIWRAPGTVVSNVPGNYQLEFRPRAGWELVSPALQVTLLTNRTVGVTNEYYRVNSSSKGRLTVLLGPDDSFIATNAGWRVADGSDGIWLTNGSTPLELPVGIHLIEFKPVPGWSAPHRRPVEIFAGGGTSSVVENYLSAEGFPRDLSLPVPIKRGEINGGLGEDPQLPYAYCGQLLTDVGYGSGVAVQSNVVLTAAHLVFNDETLSWVNSIDWFFQKHFGELDPRPIRPRGSHILAGYSSARTNALLSGLRPNESDINSRGGDVAALYFWEPAANKGYSGYLTSDPGTTNWLETTNPKLLVGYPIEGADFGYNGIERDKMHRIEAANFTFTRESPQVYLSSGFMSFPGNSGGPLCVRYDTELGAPAKRYIYYPAGVYVGSVGRASAVRVIDRDVVTLIQQANVSAEEGRNHPGGGVFPIGVPPLPGLKIGYLKIEFDPPCVTNASAKWWIDGDTNLFAGPGPVGVIAYSYTLKFSSGPGFIPPGSIIADVGDQKTNTIVARYRPAEDAGLRVTFEPAEAVSAGAQWVIDQNTNRLFSGHVLNLSSCEHLLQVLPVPGFETPSSQTLTLKSGETNTVRIILRKLPMLSLGLAEGLRLSGSSGLTYRLQYKPDLSTSSVWKNYLTITLTNNSQFLPGTIPTNGGSLFYRGLLTQ